MVSDQIFQQQIPRSQLLAQFLAQRPQLQPRTPIEGLGGAANQIAQALALRQGLNQQQQRRDAINQTLAQALQPQVVPEQPGQLGPVQPRDANIGDIARVLAGNPDTASLGLDLKLKDIQRRQDQQREIDLLKIKKTLGLGASDGGSTGAILDRLKNADPDDEIRTDIDALRLLKGGAGAQGRLGAEIDLGRAAEREKETGGLEAQLGLVPEIERAKVEAVEGERLLADKRQKLPKATNTLITINSKARRVSGDIDEIIADLNNLDIPQTRVVAQFIPLTKSKALRDKLESVKANFFVEELTEMRVNSPTGGAVGNVSNAEGDRLASTRATLDLNQPLPDLIDNLQQARLATTEAALRIEDAFQRDFSDVLTGEPPSVPDIPAAPEQQSDEVDPGLLEFMTPEERKLFGN